MKVGILGTANIARKNILAMQACEGVEAVCVGSRDLARAKAFASETGLAGVLNGEFVCVCVSLLVGCLHVGPSFCQLIAGRYDVCVVLRACISYEHVERFSAYPLYSNVWRSADFTPAPARAQRVWEVTTQCWQVRWTPCTFRCRRHCTRNGCSRPLLPENMCCGTTAKRQLRACSCVLAHTHTRTHATTHTRTHTHMHTHTHTHTHTRTHARTHTHGTCACAARNR